MNDHQDNRAIVATALALFLVPLAVDLAASDSTAPFRYFAADAFYYHTVARNLVHLGYPTFDQFYPTNGFHPLWQLSTAAIYAIVETLGAPELTYLYANLCVSAAAVSGCIWLLASTLTRGGRPLSATFALLPVGAYACVLLPAWLLAYGYVNEHEGPLPLYGTLWSYTNGMESAFALFWYAALARLIAAGRWSSLGLGAAIGACALLFTLSRLDHALLAAPLLGYGVIRALRRRERAALIPALGACALFAILLGAYLFINRAYAGTFIPISGSGKSTFPHPHLGGLRWLGFLVSHSPRAQGWLDVLCREAQLLLPALIALAWCLRPTAVPGSKLGRIWHEEGGELAISLTAIGVLLLAGYDFVFVPMIATGPWYTPVSVVFVSVVLARMTEGYRPSALRLGVSAFVCVLVFTLLQRRAGYHREFAEFYLHDAARMLEHFRSNAPRLIERDDGIVSFATGLPCMSGFGFTDDLAAAHARDAGTLLDLARTRGFRHWATLAYAPACGAGDCDAAARLEAERTFGIRDSRFRVEYRSSHTRFVVVALDP